jgi:predicted DNA-binding transcriptional regulator AlpA
MVSDQINLGQRLLSREQAAFYCSLSVSAFSRWVKAGRLPSALAGTSRWDLKAIDLALDSLSELPTMYETSEAVTSALDEWRTKRARRSERNS